MTSLRFSLPSSRAELILSFAWPLVYCACAAGGGQAEATVTQTTQPGSGATATPSTPVTGAAPSSPGGPMFNADDLEPTDACDGNLPVVYRDFSQAHPDFEMNFRGDVVRRQLIEPTLGLDGKPVFKSSVGCPAKQNTPTECETWSVMQPVITSADSYSQWYRDTPGINIAFEKVLELADSGGGLYKYSSAEFFPIGNDQGFGITPPGQAHNFLFTTEVHVTFEYVAKQKFTFRGDDDMWIFVNGRLAVDLGSMHDSKEGIIDFDAQAADLGIVVGRAYPMDIFHAERHTSASNFSIETNIACFTPAIVR
ncbi:MAG: fibro-slime domain-containing protein [Deltaproteobacteria bacterium]